MSSRVTVVGPQYSRSKLTREHQPAPDRPYPEYRQCLRQEYFFTCVYCLSTESEVGPTSAYGGFEVEHFKPKGKKRFRRLRNVYRNLLWACFACNRAKGESWPTLAEERAGYRFVDPSIEPLGEHLEIVGNRVREVGSDPAAGEYMIDELNLNSSLHVTRRKARADLADKLALLEGLHEALSARVDAITNPADRAAVRAEADDARSQVDAIRRLVDRSRLPWDAPADCNCE